MAGPLQGLRIVELVGLGAAPFCAMMFADMGADVVRIDRVSATEPLDAKYDVLARSRRSIALDLKDPESVQKALKLIDRADGLIEGFRPGVMERLGLGPNVCIERNKRLVYGRMTGWGQSGPLAQAAGHDINYIAISGALHGIGAAGAGPTIPLNYIGDFGGGGMLLAFGMMCALHEARSTGQGQVVDAAMADGAALLSAMMYGFKAAGQWSNERGENLLDGGAHFYGTYACADGKYVSVGALEPQFYKQLLELCGLDANALSPQHDVHSWPIMRHRLGDIFKTRTQAEWCRLMEGSDACFAPVLNWDDAPQHAHNLARNTFVDIAGIVQPAPAPRFSRTVPDMPCAPSGPQADFDAILADWQA